MRTGRDRRELPRGPRSVLTGAGDRDRWNAVDRFIDERLLGNDPALDATLAACADAELPAIGVSAPQGRMLELLVRMLGARMVLELGTLGGYSTICLARGLAPGGRVTTLELDPRFAEVARANLAAAGLADRVELRVGPASDSLEELLAAGAGPFDLVFIDADKQGTPEYFERALDLSRAGTLIVVDNVVRGGAIADAEGGDARVQAMRRFVKQAGAESRVRATVIQTVGAKGYDGFALALVND